VFVTAAGSNVTPFIRTTATAFSFNASTGDLVAPGNVTAYSDENIKTDWRGLGDDFIEFLATVKTGTYTRTDTGARQVGVSAQSLQKFLQEAVIADERGMLSVAYGNAALAACVKLAQRVLELEAKLKDKQ
jgi:hypothetical protein